MNLLFHDLGSKDLGLNVQIPILFMLANQEMFDIAQDCTYQVLRTFKLQKGEFKFSEA